LGAKLRTPLAVAGHRHIFNQYVVRAQRRDDLKARLTERGIGSEIYYPVPLHLQKCFAYLNHRAGDFPHSEQAAEETLALPIYPELEQAQMAHVVATIADFYGQG
jgi:dTDP-4-amino-4,6-dideoxygalactose transaminase